MEIPTDTINIDCPPAICLVKNISNYVQLFIYVYFTKNILRRILTK